MSLVGMVFEVIAETLLASPRIILATAITAAGCLWLTQTWGGTVAGAVVGLFAGIGWEVVAAWDDKRPDV